MNQRAILIFVILFIIIVAVMFAFTYIKKAEISTTNDEVVETDEQKPFDKYAGITLVTAKHFYINGIHTISGEIPMPTPCDLLEAEAFVLESSPEQIQINFSVINNADNCAQVITPQRFKVDASASESATFSAFFMKRPIELNLIEAEDGETPDNFDIYIKG